MMIRDVKKDTGFSLIELAILLTIVSLMVATSLQSFRQYNVTKTRNDTYAHRDVIEQALTRFIYNFHRLPCPADPSLAPGDALAGLEQCLTAAGQTAVGFCSGKVCRVMGGRYTDDAPLPLTYVNENVLTGAIPYATVGIPLSQTIDGYGSKFGYTVTEYLTRQGSGAPHSGTYSDQYGVINILSYFHDTDTFSPAKNQNVAGGAFNAAYMMALVSYGPNRKGGYAYNGGLIAPCTGTGRDIENCNGDATFVSPSKGIYSYVDNARYFDDPVVDAVLSLESDKWKYASTSGIRDKTGGKVGINTGSDVPVTPLQVYGNILTDTYNAVNFCDGDGTNCLPMKKLTTTGMSCDQGIMYGVQSNTFLCADKINTTTLTPKICAAGEYVTGFDNTGEPICCPPTGACP